METVHKQARQEILSLKENSMHSPDLRKAHTAAASCAASGTSGLNPTCRGGPLVGGGGTSEGLGSLSAAPIASASACPASSGLIS